MSYVADKEIVDVDDWATEELTQPGPARSMGELAAEAEALALVRAWMLEEVANDAEG